MGSKRIVFLCVLGVLLAASQGTHAAFTSGKLNGESDAAMKKRMMQEALRLKSSAKLAAMEHGRKLASVGRPGLQRSHVKPQARDPSAPVPPRKSVPRVQRVKRERPNTEYAPFPGKAPLQSLKNLQLKRLTPQKVNNCNNGKHDPNTESDVDCGGICIYALKLVNHYMQPAHCQHGQKCKTNDDCKSGNCTPEGQCQARRFLEARSDDVSQMSHVYSVLLPHCSLARLRRF
jgi:hypothetical protein